MFYFNEKTPTGDMIIGRGYPILSFAILHAYDWLEVNAYKISGVISNEKFRCIVAEKNNKHTNFFIDYVKEGE